MSTGRQYEFTQEQNSLIGSLSTKMGVVGMFLAIVGVLQILLAILIVVAIYRDRIPAQWIEKLPAETRAQVEKQTADLPPRNQLWAYALNTGVVGLFYLLMGSWTRSAANSFRKIVETQGSDITHLMNALTSLHSMYALVYTLLMITILLAVVFLGLALFHRFAG